METQPSTYRLSVTVTLTPHTPYCREQEKKGKPFNYHHFNLGKGNNLEGCDCHCHTGRRGRRKTSSYEEKSLRERQPSPQKGGVTEAESTNSPLNSPLG